MHEHVSKCDKSEKVQSAESFPGDPGSISRQPAGLSSFLDVLLLPMKTKALFSSSFYISDDMPCLLFCFVFDFLVHTFMFSYFLRKKWKV